MGRIIIALSLEVILLAVTIQTGESINCYSCISNENTKCADPIDKSGVTEVDCGKIVSGVTTSVVRNGVAALRKAFGMPGIHQESDLNFDCLKIDYSDEYGSKHTLRSCTTAKSEGLDSCAMLDSLSMWTEGKSKVDFCETCETDLCNGASMHSFTIISVLVVPSFAIIISHWVGV